MSKATRVHGSRETNSTKLTLRIWHPNCWTLRVTESTDAGLIGHGVFKIGTQVQARFTAYADTVDELEKLEEEIEASSLTDSVEPIHEFFNPNTNYEAAGNATRELLVKYPAHNSIHDEMISRGFVPDDSIRIRNGNEFWTVISSQHREEIQRNLDRIRSSMNAEIEVEAMKTPSSPGGTTSSLRKLSERQREVFELARREGYYTWPREVSVADLANEADVSKATILEHLRKAEAKLLSPGI